MTVKEPDLMDDIKTLASRFWQRMHLKAKAEEFKANQAKADPDPPTANRVTALQLPEVKVTEPTLLQPTIVIENLVLPGLVINLQGPSVNVDVMSVDVGLTTHVHAAGPTINLPPTEVKVETPIYVNPTQVLIDNRVQVPEQRQPEVIINQTVVPAEIKEVQVVLERKPALIKEVDLKTPNGPVTGTIEER